MRGNGRIQLLHRPMSRDGDMSRNPKMPKVLLVTPQPFFEERGTPIAVALAARALAESGLAVDILAFPIGSEVRIPGVRVRRCANPLGFRHVPVGFSPRKMLLDLSLLRSFARLLAGGEYTVVHAVEEAAWLAAIVCPRAGVPFVYDMASSIPGQLSGHRVLGRHLPQRVLRALERGVVRRATHVVCSGGLGPYVRSIEPRVPRTEWRFPILQERATPEQVARLRDENAILPTDRVLLYTGNFSGYQGLDLLLEAFMRAAASDLRLLLVCVGASDGRQVEAFTSRIPAALLGRVRVLPRQPRTMMPAWFQIADCLVSLRTQGDNIPLKIFEYMATGRPIVASRGAAHEPVLDESRAFLCDADADDVARAIHRVFAEPVRARAVALAAAEHANRNYSWSRFRRLVGDIYQKLLDAETGVLERTAVRQH
jgi:glycosyltransferase involved in cell wall biosynthesis